MTASAYPITPTFEHASFPSPDEVASELHLLGLLRSAGLHEAADRRLDTLVSRAPFVDAVDAARNAAAERRSIDRWLAEQHGGALRTFVPSATLNAEGLPRFVVAVPRDANDSVLQSIRDELAGRGADAELRNFLDEILTDELAYIDFDPGVGFAVLSAASAPVPATAACAVSEVAGEVLALDASIDASELGAFIRVLRNVNASVTVDSLVNETLSDAREFVVHAGIASAVPGVVHGALGAIRDGRLAAVTWRSVQRPGDSPMSGDAFHHEIDNAGTVLGVLGFTHFALAQVHDDVELVPLAAARGNELIIDRKSVV